MTGGFGLTETSVAYGKGNGRGTGKTGGKSNRGGKGKAGNCKGADTSGRCRKSGSSEGNTRTPFGGLCKALDALATVPDPLEEDYPNEDGTLNEVASEEAMIAAIVDGLNAMGAREVTADDITPEMIDWVGQRLGVGEEQDGLIDDYMARDAGSDAEEEPLPLDEAALNEALIDDKS